MARNRIIPATFTPDHPTANLPGYAAKDFAGAPGDVAVAGFTGTVTRVSGRSPALGGKPGGSYGYSLYVTAANGVRRFLTHFATLLVGVGSVVTPGTKLGTIADSAVSGKPGTSHIHVGSTDPGGGGRTGVPAKGSLSREQLAALWLEQGGNPKQAAMAAQVAWEESRGNRNAHNLTRREDSRGLWQINVRAHPTWALRDLYNPRVNAQAAIAISRNGRDWGPWTTARAARAALAGQGSSGGGGVVRPGGEAGGGGGIGGALGSVWDSAVGAWREVTGWAGALVALVAFITNPLSWLRALEVLFGFALVLVGIAILVAEFVKSGPAPAIAARSVTAASRARKAVA